MYENTSIYAAYGNGIINENNIVITVICNIFIIDHIL